MRKPACLVWVSYLCEKTNRTEEDLLFQTNLSIKPIKKKTNNKQQTNKHTDNDFKKKPKKKKTARMTITIHKTNWSKTKIGSEETTRRGNSKLYRLINSLKSESEDSKSATSLCMSNKEKGEEEGDRECDNREELSQNECQLQKNEEYKCKKKRGRPKKKKKLAQKDPKKLSTKRVVPRPYESNQRFIYIQIYDKEGGKKNKQTNKKKPTPIIVLYNLLSRTNKSFYPGYAPPSGFYKSRQVNQMAEAYRSLNEKADQICAQRFGVNNVPVVNVMKCLSEDGIDSMLTDNSSVQSLVKKEFEHVASDGNDKKQVLQCKRRASNVKTSRPFGKQVPTTNATTTFTAKKRGRPRKEDTSAREKMELDMFESKSHASVAKPSTSDSLDVNVTTRNHFPLYVQDPSFSITTCDQQHSDSKSVDTVIASLSSSLTTISASIPASLSVTAEIKPCVENNDDKKQKELPAQNKDQLEPLNVQSNVEKKELIHEHHVEIRRASLLASFGVKSAINNLRNKMNYCKNTDALLARSLSKVPKSFGLMMGGYANMDTNHNNTTNMNNVNNNNNDNNNNNVNNFNNNGELTLYCNRSNKKFKCSECNQWFAQKCHCMRHERSQHGILNTEERYVCQYCPKSFKQKSNRNIHELIHSSDYFISHFWRCDYCPLEVPETKRRFTRKSSLKRHIDGKHTNVTWEQVKYRLPDPPLRETDDELMENEMNINGRITHAAANGNESSDANGIPCSDNDNAGQARANHNNQGVVKRKRGRPKGSKNSKKKIKVIEEPQSVSVYIKQESVSNDSVHDSDAITSSLCTANTTSTTLEHHYPVPSDHLTHEIAQQICDDNRITPALSDVLTDHDRPFAISSRDDKNNKSSCNNTQHSNY
ncbi:hypothetical protein RFI_07792 [Reticulomyxa filosa]|uniref:C2H2-type domain-containing protein n=1 Tax=Reticulomyxa filosa TaxID=46433 RepID=X6NVM3_RETFI|nr:hypothetical protein RFI_07792 [Reticulomyxa filosa]|eukprot:ETO29332.1 hypothetical protein RFI_07792 [Reticulomyxa filosa]